MFHRPNVFSGDGSSGRLSPRYLTRALSIRHPLARLAALRVCLRVNDTVAKEVLIILYVHLNCYLAGATGQYPLQRVSIGRG